MTFFVRKNLATGPIRFGVTPRKAVEAIDHEPGLSTGPAGDFIRKREGGFFFADERNVADPSVPLAPSITRVPFLASLNDKTPRGYGFLAMIALGALLVLLGFLVVARKGGQGFVEVVLGIILITVPIVMTAQRRKQLREEEEKKRAEREALEARHRQMLASYTAALERLRRERSDDAVEALARERHALELPYEIWSSAARQTVLRAGFETLASLGPAGAAQVAALMNRTSEAAGLSSEDAADVRLDIYRSVLWHLLADDRLGDSQTAQLKQLREGLGVAEERASQEASAIEEFRRLRGITHSSLPKEECSIPLGFKEYCIHRAHGSILASKKKGWVEQGPCDVYVTNKRIIVAGRKTTEVTLPNIDDVDVDIDAGLLAVRTADPAKPITVRVEDPIYTASLIDISTHIDERPKGFA